ncbi:MAG: ATP-binding cassette subfamily F protein 3 [Candidatus Azotimanducaceae bacterium]|jgi:ABC-type multidrug transport system ATPase subunit
MFLIIRINRPNYLILDEPTNHIDIQGKEELEAQIIESEATVVIESGKLIELNDPSSFYHQALQRNPHSPAAPSPAAPSSDNNNKLNEAHSGEDLLARLVELEDKLAADLERKPKFQKPRLQESWRVEIDDLQQRLD